VGTVSEELSKLEDERGWRGGRIVGELENVDGEQKLLVRDLHSQKPGRIHISPLREGVV
jgi:hypothetical protein